MKILQCLVIGCACWLPLAASAQWQWIDGGGKKVFSDQPPPADIPEKNILRRAGMPPASHATSAPSRPSAADAEPAVQQPADSGANAKPTGVDKELEEKTRKAEEAEKARQAAEAQKLAKAEAENCGRARQGMTTLDSGIRIARVNADGEREIMDDAARAVEQKRLQSVIDSNCK